MKAIKNITKRLPEVAGLGAGAIAQGYAEKFIPVDNALVKNGITTVLGVILMGQKSKIVASAGAGMVATSIQKIAGSFGIGAVEDPIMDLDLDPGAGDDAILGMNGEEGDCESELETDGY